MKDEDIVAKVATMFNVAYHLCPSKNENWSDTYKVHVRGQKARQLMLILLPLMGQRRQGQIHMALSACKTKGRNKILNWDDVVKIRLRLVDGETCRAIAKDYSVSNQTISNIGCYKIWKQPPAGVFSE